jgi:hypothetical protein
MILNKQTEAFNNKFDAASFVKIKNALEILDKQPDFQKELIDLFEIDVNKTNILQIGNAKQLIMAINLLDNQCTKRDITVKMKELHLQKLLEGEKAIFEIMGITDPFLLKENRSDILRVETRYSAKSEILDYFHFSKFANYCRDNEFEDLIDTVKDYLELENFDNKELKKLRIIYVNEDSQFFLRAFTSSQEYKDFGINFSVLVALLSIGKYIEATKKGIYINHFSVDDSNLYVSFAFTDVVEVSSNLTLSFNLILENDEVKRGAVSFNGIFKLKITEKNKSSEITLMPKVKKNDDSDYATDLLTYAHRGSVEKVFQKIGELPTLIDYFIGQVSEDAKKIALINHPNDVKKYIADKIRGSRKPEFKQYKSEIFRKLMEMNVDNTFSLFNLLREVEDLFEHEDVIAINFWRMKLYEVLVTKK